MTTQEKIEVMKAYTEGKKIQVREIGAEHWSNWILSLEPDWNWFSCEYRIKPENKYRPYKDTDEMIEDFKRRAEIATNKMSLPWIWIKSKKDGYRFLLSVFGAVAVDGITFSDLLDEYTYLDGSPCGMKEEE